MLGFIYFEGEALRVLVRHMGYPAKRSHGFVYSAADVYFSAITPSASGGQPASAYFMLKDGIAGTAVMAALLLNLIMYTLAILTIGLVDILIFPERGKPYGDPGGRAGHHCGGGRVRHRPE